MIDEKLLTYLEGCLTEKRLKRFNSVLSERTKHFTVATEDVYQLHNTSAVIRSCDVFGIQEINIIEEKNSKNIDKEIAMGSQKWVDVNRYNNVKECISSLKSNGYQIVATTPHVKDCNLYDFDVTKKSCFFFGTESDGLSQEAINSADTFLKIPMVGFTESLNISVSAAIILQYVTTKLKQTTSNWELTELEKQVKRLDWCIKTIKSVDQVIERFYKKS